MSEQFVASPRTQRVNLRTSERQEALLKQAAQAADTTLSDFVLRTAVTEAERVLADRRWFVASEEEYAAFIEILNRDVDVTQLSERMAEETPFGKSFSLDK